MGNTSQGTKLNNKSQGKIYVCVLISFAAIGGRTVWICTVRTARRESMIFEAVCWHRNRGCLECFLAAIGSYCSGRTVDCGHVFLGTVF
jgi:hypothetical protein